MQHFRRMRDRLFKLEHSAQYPFYMIRRNVFMDGRFGEITFRTWKYFLRFVLENTYLNISFYVCDTLYKTPSVTNFECNISRNHC